MFSSLVCTAPRFFYCRVPLRGRCLRPSGVFGPMVHDGPWCMCLRRVRQCFVLWCSAVGRGVSPWSVLLAGLSAVRGFSPCFVLLVCLANNNRTVRGAVFAHGRTMFLLHGASEVTILKNSMFIKII